MKSKPCITFLLIFTIFVSCTQKKQNSTLLQAESLVEEYPDSALHLLQNINDPYSFSKSDYANYALLMIQALDKNYQTYSDTLLRAATDYFLEGDDPIKKAKTYFYLGCFNKNTYYTKEAQECFLKALDAAKNTNDNKLIGLIYNRLGNLYRTQQMYEEALNAHYKSYSHFTRLYKTKTEIAGLNEIGRDLSDMGKNDTALVYYKKALALVEKTDRINATSILNDIAIVYLKSGQLDLALKYVDQSIELEDVKSELAHNYLVKGQIFIKLQQYDSAHYYFDKVQDCNKILPTSDSYKELYQIEKSQKNFSNAVKYSDLYFSLEDSIKKIMQASTLTTIEKRYQYDLLKAKNIHLSSSLQKKETLLYQTLLGLIISIIFFTWLNKRLKRIKDKVIQEKEALLKENEAELIIKNSTLEQQEKLIEDNKNRIAEEKALLLKKEKELDEELKRFQTQDFNFRFKLFVETEIYKVITTNISTRTPLNKKNEEEIIDITNKLFNKFATQLHNYDLSTTNICFCCLLKLFPAYTTEQLAILFNVTTRAIEQRKYRIKKIILGEDSTNDLTKFLMQY